jgi:hypothetical protein
MSKVTLDLNNQQIEKLVERLPINIKIKLVCKLEQETLRQRWDSVMKDIDKRLKRFPISEEEIAKEIGSYRKEKYAKGCY